MGSTFFTATKCCKLWKTKLEYRNMNSCVQSHACSSKILLKFRSVHVRVPRGPYVIFKKPEPSLKFGMPGNLGKNFESLGLIFVTRISIPWSKFWNDIKLRLRNEYDRNRAEHGFEVPGNLEKDFALWFVISGISMKLSKFWNVWYKNNTRLRVRSNTPWATIPPFLLYQRPHQRLTCETYPFRTCHSALNLTNTFVHSQHKATVKIQQRTAGAFPKRNKSIVILHGVTDQNNPRIRSLLVNDCWGVRKRPWSHVLLVVQFEHYFAAIGQFMFNTLAYFVNRSTSRLVHKGRFPKDSSRHAGLSFILSLSWNGGRHRVWRDVFGDVIALAFPRNEGSPDVFLATTRLA